MNKKSLKKIRSIASALMPQREQRLVYAYESTIVKDKQGLPEKDLLGRIKTTSKWVGLPLWFPVNHYRRIKRLLKKGDAEGAKRYVNKAIQAAQKHLDNLQPKPDKTNLFQKIKNFFKK